MILYRKISACQIHESQFHVCDHIWASTSLWGRVSTYPDHFYRSENKDMERFSTCQGHTVFQRQAQHGQPRFWVLEKQGGWEKQSRAGIRDPEIRFHSTQKTIWPSVVKNPPSNAGDAGSTPGQGTKIPYTAGQLSPRSATKSPPATTKDPACHN